MDAVTFAVLSDLHIGKGARAKDLCPHADGPLIEDGYRKRFLDFISANSITAKYLVVPGDVTHTAAPEEVELASSIICDVATRLNVPKERIVFIPGNHDVDWGVLGLGTHQVRWAQRYDPLKQTSAVFKQLMDSSIGHVLDSPYVALWEFDDLIIVGFNSSWHDKRDVALHHGIIDDAQLKELSQTLDSLRGTSDKLRVFLVHHHPIQYDNPVPGHADFSQMVNGEQLLDLLVKHKFDFLIHGHTHQPRFKTIEIDSGHHLGILAAGSFSLDLPREWAGKVNNQFHLIEFDGRDATDRVVLGTVFSWTFFFAHGWLPSDPTHHGISYREPFGIYWTPARLESELRGALDRLFSDRHWIDWNTLVSAVPQLRHIRPTRIVESLDLIAASGGFRVHDRSLDRMMLLKEAV